MVQMLYGGQPIASSAGKALYGAKGTQASQSCKRWAQTSTAALLLCTYSSVTAPTSHRRTSPKMVCMVWNVLRNTPCAMSACMRVRMTSSGCTHADTSAPDREPDMTDAALLFFFLSGTCCDAALAAIVAVAAVLLVCCWRPTAAAAGGGPSLGADRSCAGFVTG